MIHKFHGLKIDKPMSEQLRNQDFDKTQLGQLKLASDGNIKLIELPHDYRQADYVWKVVNVQFSTEDTTMTRFRAFGLDGKMLPEAVFGIWYGSLKAELSGYFDYPLAHGTQYYVPVDNRFMTVNEGGYEVQVLDTQYPSEALKFGLVKSGDKHECLVIDFRLFELNSAVDED